MSRDADTSLDLGGRQFPSTQWSMIIDPDEPDKHEPLDALAESYWRPVYSYIRARWSQSNEDAKDLTQAFFVWMLDTEFVRRADPSRGRFRAFVKVSLEHFLRDAERHRTRKVRGGDRARVELDDQIVDIRGSSPAELLDDAWRAELVTQATRQLEAEYQAQGRPVYFAVFRDYLLDEAGDTDYAGVAERHGLTVDEVGNYLRHAKRLYQSLLRKAVAETVGDHESLAAELRWLVGRDER